MSAPARRHAAGFGSEAPSQPRLSPRAELMQRPDSEDGSELLWLATAGSVDDGKSTLIGRLLYDSKQLFEDQLAAVEASSERRGDGHVNLALVTDGLRAEREQGITIDVAYRYFATPRRRFILADTPGHARYTRNMITGASRADVSMVLVDARHGMTEQSRRHTFIAALLQVRHLVVCVNKMDLVGFDEGVYSAILDDFRTFAAKLDVPDIAFIPMSALHGDNVVERSRRMPWYQGPPLLYHLEHVHVASDRNLIDARLPVQWVIRPMSDDHHDYRGYAGQVAGGVFRRGDDVVVLPSGARTRIAAIDAHPDTVEEAFAPMSVALRLEDELDVSRGDLICRAGNRPAVGREIEAMVCWMSERPLSMRGRYVLKHATRSAAAVVEELAYRIDVDSLHRDETAEGLELNDIGRVTLRTAVPIAYDPYQRNRVTGSFILIDAASNDTVAAGMIMEPRRARSDNVVWQAGAVARERRWASTGQHGATIWITGLPASGKSTLAAALARRLIERGVLAYVLDGDNLRHGLNGDLGFDRESRRESVRRAAEAARLLADAGAVVLVSLVSPHADDRDAARARHAADGLRLVEVFVDTPLEECERRDPKGHYALARRGELADFTGVGAPYERPSAADVVIGPGEALDDAVARVLAVIDGERGS